MNAPRWYKSECARCDGHGCDACDHEGWIPVCNGPSPRNPDLECGETIDARDGDRAAFIACCEANGHCAACGPIAAERAAFAIADTIPPFGSDLSDPVDTGYSDGLTTDERDLVHEEGFST